MVSSEETAWSHCLVVFAVRICKIFPEFSSNCGWMGSTHLPPPLIGFSVVQVASLHRFRWVLAVWATPVRNLHLLGHMCMSYPGAYDTS